METSGSIKYLIMQFTQQQQQFYAYGSHDIDALISQINTFTYIFPAFTYLFHTSLFNSIILKLKPG